jgi:hypothetical protein
MLGACRCEVAAACGLGFAEGVCPEGGAGDGDCVVCAAPWGTLAAPERRNRSVAENNHNMLGDNRQIKLSRAKPLNPVLFESESEDLFPTWSSISKRFVNLRRPNPSHGA